MRALVIGSSNGFINSSYIRAIQATFGVDNTVNRSLGASQASMLPYRIKDTDLSQFDYVFIETAVNDAPAIHSGVYSMELHGKILRWIVSKVRATGAVPVSLFIPSLPLTNRIDELLALNLEVFDGVVIDYLSALKQIAEKLELDGPALYKDPFHPEPGFTHAVTTEAIKNLLSIDVRSIAQAASPEFSYEFTGLRALAENNRLSGVTLPAGRQVRTTFVEDEVFSLAEGSKVILKADGESLMALVVNQSMTRTYLHVRGAQAIEKDLRFDMGKPDDKMLVSSFAQPVGPDSQDEISLEVARRPLAEGYERKLSFFVKPDQMELSGVLMERRNHNEQSSITNPASNRLSLRPDQFERIVAEVAQALNLNP